MKLQLSLAAAAFAVSFGGCNCGGNTVCGAGTVEKDGECVTTGGSHAGEGEGEGGEGEGEGEQIVCGPGTVLNGTGTECVPECADPRVFDPTTNGCICPTGLIATANGCSVDPNLCADGTIFSDATGECLPATAQPPSDDDTGSGDPVVITLPGVGQKPLELGGVFGKPTFGQNDVDTWTFTGTAGTRLRISAVSFGAEAASFVLAGNEDPNAPNGLGAYARFGFPAGENTATREVVLPLDGTYVIQTTEKSTFTDVFGIIPTGGPDYTYNLVIETLPAELAISLADENDHTGNLDSVDQYAVSTAYVNVGDFALANLASANANAVQCLWLTINGRYIEFDGGGVDAVALASQVTGGVHLFADYVFNLAAGDPLDYTLNVAANHIIVGPQPGETIQDSTGGQDFSFVGVDLQANHVYRVRVQMPETSTVAALGPPTAFCFQDSDCLATEVCVFDDLFFDTVCKGSSVRLVDAALNPIARCGAADFDPDSDGQEFECRLFATDAEAGTAYVEFVDQDDEGLVVSNNNLRVTLDEAAVEAPISISFSGPDVVRSTNAPSPSDSDEWNTPWFIVTPSSIVDLTQTTSNGVLMNVFSRSDFSALTLAPTASDVRIGLPGSSLLVQATLGPATGTFDFTVHGAVPPFNIEVEANGDGSTANNLPVVSETVGSSSPGDGDYYRIVTLVDGLVSVTVTDPPFTPAGDVQVEILDTDATTVLAGPAFFAPQFAFNNTPVQTFLPAGTHFARVSPISVEFLPPGTTSQPGAYSISWTIDPNFTPPDPPPSCTDPLDVGVGVIESDTTNGDALFATADNTCLPFPSGAYIDSPEAAYSFRVPAGATLIADITAASFDTAISILLADNCSPEACVAGADNGIEIEHAEYLNDTDAEVQVVIVVDGFGGGRGTFTLELALFGSACRIGEQRCAGNDLEVCNATGDGFDTVTCAAGCVFDDFELRGVCQPFCGPGTGLAATLCDDATTLSTCRADGGAYDTTSCAVACTGDAAAGICTFGLCSTLDATTCATQDVLTDGVDDAVLVECNADASLAVTTACDNDSTCSAVDACSSNLTPVSICVPLARSCTANVADSCDDTGSVLTQEFCQFGCDGDRCPPAFGEDCSDPGLIGEPGAGVTFTLSGDTTGHVDDVAGSCEFFGPGTGPDVVTSFTATTNASLTIATPVDSGPFDSVLYVYKDVCPAPTEAACSDNFGGAGVETIDVNVQAGHTYFIVVDTFLDDSEAAPFTLTVTNNN